MSIIIGPADMLKLPLVHKFELSHLRLETIPMALYYRYLRVSNRNRILF
jgi:hypothetical protein